MDIFTNYLEQVYAPNNTQTNYTAGLNAMVDAINRNFAKIMSEPILRGEKGTSVRTETLPMWVLSGTAWKLTAIGAAIMNTIYGPASQHASDMMVGGSSIVPFSPFNEGDDAINIFPDVPGFINLQTRPALVEDRFYTIDEQTQQRRNLTNNSWEYINPLSDYNQDLIRRGERNERLYVRCFVTDETRSRTRRFFTNMYVFYDARIPQLETVYNDYIGRPRPSNPSMNSQFEIWFDRSCSIYGSIDETNTLGWQCEYYTITPKLYWQSDIERFCWQINDVRTGVSAQGLMGPAGSNASICVGCGVLDPPAPQSPTRCTINYVFDGALDSGGFPICQWVGVNDNPPEEGSFAIVFSCSNDLQLPTPIDPSQMPYGEVLDALFGIVHINNGIYYIDYFASSGIAGIYISILDNLFNRVGYSASQNLPSFRRGYVLRHGDVSRAVSNSEIVAMLFSTDTVASNHGISIGNVKWDVTPRRFTPMPHTMEDNMVANESDDFRIYFNTHIYGGLCVDGKKAHDNNIISAQGTHNNIIENSFGSGNNELKTKTGFTIVKDKTNHYTIPSRSNGVLVSNNPCGTLQVKTDYSTPQNSGAITATVGHYTDVFVGCPVGTIIMYGGLIDFKDGLSNTESKNAKRIINYENDVDLVFVEKDWVLCNGVMINSVDYEDNGIFKKLKDIGALQLGFSRNLYLPNLILRFPSGAKYTSVNTNGSHTQSPYDPYNMYPQMTQYMSPLHGVGGEYAHTLTIAEMPSHTHQGFANNADSGRTIGGLSSNGTSSTRATGSNEPHNNIPPFYAVNFIMKYR